MKTLIKGMILIFSLSSLYAGNSNDKVFEQMRVMYEAGKVKTVKLPYEKKLELKSIFGLPKSRQKEAWNKVVNDTWDNVDYRIKKRRKY